MPWEIPKKISLLAVAILFLFTFFNLILDAPRTSFFKNKKSKRVTNSRNQGFFYYFCMMIEGSGSGSIPLTNGSGSGRPKNKWIRWIRIRNTDRKIAGLMEKNRVEDEVKCVCSCLVSCPLVGGSWRAGTRPLSPPAPTERSIRLLQLIGY